MKHAVLSNCVVRNARCIKITHDRYNASEILNIIQDDFCSELILLLSVILSLMKCKLHGKINQNGNNIF